MKREEFPSSARGEARQVAAAGYWAYFPTRLPRSINYTESIVAALDEATGALHRLSGVGRLLPNPNLFLTPHLRLEAVLSSRIEGTQSEVADLLRFEAGDDERVAQLHATSER